MISIPSIRTGNNKIIVMGNHEALIQSILDFDFYCGNDASVISIIASRTGYAKYFWGRSEILLPTVTEFNQIANLLDNGTTNIWLLNISSGRRTLSSTQEFMEAFPNAAGAALFAENVPERHALSIINTTYRNLENDSVPLIVGPASVGLLVPGALKLGPVGGITPDQITESHITEPGSIAVMSASGGMTNELINIAISAGHRLSFALSFGGDRFPVLSPRDAFLLAESDPETRAVLYYGELGGEDEYELVKLKDEKLFTKQVIAHVAGTVASLFPESPQFGHAKAKADNARVTAIAKRKALRSVGFSVSNSFSEFIEMVRKIRSL